ncbi:hypothetical protein ACFV42_29530 [Streptomyces solisilvae]|uniref:hypothetical protein n=1 Tax=Streptomyces malaysiensis TaxID=92644 RepID=UPI00369AF5F7
MAGFDAGRDKPRPPAKLGAAGRRLWREIVERYELRPDEARILGDACREADIVERLEAELADAPLMVKGSMGQLVAPPLVSEARQHRSVLVALLKSLKLPDAPADAQRKRTPYPSRHVPPLALDGGTLRGCDRCAPPSPDNAFLSLPMASRSGCPPTTG